MRPFLIGLAWCAALTGCLQHREVEQLPDRNGHAGPHRKAPRPLAAGSFREEMFITVLEGDTLALIAATYGITVEHLIRRNRILRSIKVGDNLIVPRAMPQPPTSASPER